jgi:hypothetical protein
MESIMLNRIRRSLRRTGPALLAAVLVASSVAHAEAQLVLYDDFAAGRIDESRWTGRQFVTRIGGTGDLLEIQREVTSAHALVLQTRVVGGSSADGGVFALDNALVFRHGNAISEIVFDVTVRRADVRGCSPGQDAEAGARGVFPLFNDGAGDVVAIVALMTSSASTAAATELEATASLVHRTAEGDVILGAVALGPAAPGQPVRLRMRWDAARDRVRFQKDAEPAMTIDYLNPVTGPAAGSPKYLAVTSSVTDCSAHPTSAAVLAVFDNVRINQ